MKKFLEFAGFCALGLAVVGLILMMATPAVVTKDADALLKGTEAIFGGQNFDPVILGLLAWIFGLLGILVLGAVVVLPLLKIKALDKFAGVLNLVAVGALVTAGILVFFTEPAFGAANEWSEEAIKAWTLGGGYVAAGILSIIGGAVAILPAAVDFIGKKK